MKPDCTVLLATHFYNILAASSAIPLWAMLWAARAALAAVIVAGLWHWVRRRRAWLQNDLERWPQPIQVGWGMYGFVLIASLFVGIAGLFWPESGQTPQCLSFVALACLFVGHRAHNPPAGIFGLALLVEGIVTAATAWLPSSAFSLPLGLALAGTFFFWMARFWRQQLLDGRPWTTAGRLIPATRAIAYAAALAALTASLWIFFQAVKMGLAQFFQAGPLWLPVATVLVLILLGALLIRDVTDRKNAPAAWTTSA